MLRSYLDNTIARDCRAQISPHPLALRNPAPPRRPHPLFHLLPSDGTETTPPVHHPQRRHDRPSRPPVGSRLLPRWQLGLRRDQAHQPPGRPTPRVPTTPVATPHIPTLHIPPRRVPTCHLRPRRISTRG